MSTNWSPQVARAMHELSNASPAPPSVSDLDHHSPPPPNGTPTWLTVAAAVIVVAAVAGLVALVGRDEPTPVNGPGTTTPGLVQVRHDVYRVDVTSALTCPQPFDTTAGYMPYTVETWSDRDGRQWRTSTTYANGQVVDEVVTGSAIYPTGHFVRGEQPTDVRVGCTGPADEPFPLVADMFSGSGYFALDVGSELIDERAYVNLFADIAERSPGDHVDSMGRPSQLWEQRTDGFAGYGNAADRPLVQVQQWFVDPTDGSTVTERQFTNTVDGLGTATVRGTLMSSESITVPADVFDTTGYRPMQTFPRPDLLTNPPGETTPSTTSVPPQLDPELVPEGSVLRFEEPLSGLGDGATVRVYDTSDGFQVCTFVQSTSVSGGGCEDRTNIDEGRSYGFLGDGHQGIGLLFGLAPVDIGFTATVGELTLFPDEHGFWYTVVPADVTQFTLSSSKGQQVVPLMTPGPTAPGTTVALTQSP